MKKLVLLFIHSFVFINLMGQAPALINYQGVARNSVGNVLPDQSIRLRLSIHDSTASGKIVYQESRTLKTNYFGMFTVAIGSTGASDVTGTLAGVSWTNGGNKFLQVEVDPRGGNSLIDMGTAQLLSVPYALAAGSAAPSGKASGGLSGTYPNPTVAHNTIGTSHIVDSSITAAKLARGVIPASIPVSGNAGGDLQGLYPNPQIAADAITTAKIVDGGVTTSKVADGAITLSKLAPGVIPTSIPLSGAAGGDLEGTYPNPLVVAGAITTAKIADNSITTAKIADNSITTAKIADNSITTTKIADNTVSTSKITDGSVTAAKLAPGVIPTSLPITGTASGDLEGTYPNPSVAASAITTAKIADGAITSSKIADGTITTSKIADGTITLSKLGAGVIPTSLAPTGTASGDLSGTYPNPVIASDAVSTSKVADGAITTSKVADGAITLSKLAPGVIPTSIPLSGAAGGDLEGTYPNPLVVAGAITTAKIADNSVTTAKIADNSISTSKIADNTVSTSKITDGSVTAAKLAPGVIPTSLPITGTASGDLSGTYPNPVIASGAVSTSKVADGAITTSKVVDGAITNTKLADLSVSTAKVEDGSITASKLAPGLIVGGSFPSGSAGGDLSGNYPNPNIASNAITNSKIANGAVITPKLANDAVTTNKIADGAITAAKLAPGVIPTSIPVSGTAGGDLAGSFPNPTVLAGAITNAKIADNSISTLKIADGAITNAKIADGSISTSKIADGTITLSKLDAGIIPTSLPPNGTATGDLSGVYPNPSVSKLQGTTVSTTAPSSGQVLKFDGSQWLPSADLTGGFTLPYVGAMTATTSLITITNPGSGAAIETVNSSNSANVSAIVGKITSITPGLYASGLRGINSGTATNGAGVWGSHAAGGQGVYGSAVTGSGVYGSAISGVGLYGSSISGSGIFSTSDQGTAASFDISNPDNYNDALFVSHNGGGNGISSMAMIGSGVTGTTYYPDGTGVTGYNFGGGEGVFGYASSNISSGVIGRNDDIYAGVKGLNNANGGIGILAVANGLGSTGGNALVAELRGSGTGNLAVFKHNNSPVARIDHTGKAYFNGGTQISGADIAEYFGVEGSRTQYEAGDVLIISETSDRKVEKSTSAYSTLVAGVYATRPGVMLTEENAEQDDLEKMVPMGVIGVIPTKVCLEGGIIKRGDLIVTSSQAGVAMKADIDKVKVGQVLGKALQDYNQQGVAKINVLISVK